jgi:hypothetical protein
MPGLIPNNKNNVVMPGLISNDKDSKNQPALGTDVNDNLIANIFCLEPLPTRILASCITTAPEIFSFMSLDGNVCFFVMYHNKTNTIFATPIPGLDLKNTLDAYTKNFEHLMSKGYTPKISVMDNQATKAIKSYLTPQQCHLQLIEPGNHQVNTAECTIQTFKNHFIGDLGTMVVDFLIQLWDTLAPQVQDSIILLQRSRINPDTSVYKTLKGPYD